jgi:hypothetical protein
MAPSIHRRLADPGSRGTVGFSVVTLKKLDSLRRFADTVITKL